MEGPDLLGEDSFYLRAFERLSTCRQVGMDQGPIAWRDVVDYGDRCGLDRGNTDALVVIITAMDRAYLAWHRDNPLSPEGKE